MYNKRKILFLAAVAMMTAMNVNAQSAGEWTFKTRVGGNLSTVSNNDDNPYQVAIDSPYPYSYQFDGCGFDGQCIYGQLLDDVSVGVAAPRVSTGQPAAVPLYDLQGRRVQQPMRHGLYVRGGKKVVR